MSDTDQVPNSPVKPDAQEHALVALMSLPARDSSAPETPAPKIGGRGVPSHQIDFALACGAGQVVILGDGASEIAVALRHQAEAAGLQFSIASGPHSLAGIIRDSDWVLALQPDLFAQNNAAIEAVRTADGERILTLASGAGTHAGFERIDLERAWAGLLLLDAKRMGELLTLPEDSDPFPALLRIALQARLPEVQLADQALSDASWTKIGPDSDLPVLEASWLARVIPKGNPPSLSSHFAAQMLKMAGRWLLPADKSLPAILAFGGAVLIGAIACLWFGYAGTGFILLALGTPFFALATALISVSRGPFSASQNSRFSLSKILGFAPDAVLFICCWLAADGSWFLGFLPPALLLFNLHNEQWRPTGGFRASLVDRVVIALLLAAWTAYIAPRHDMMFGPMSNIVMFIAALNPAAAMFSQHIKAGKKSAEEADKFEG